MYHSTLKAMLKIFFILFDFLFVKW